MFWYRDDGLCHPTFHPTSRSKCWMATSFRDFYRLLLFMSNLWFKHILPLHRNQVVGSKVSLHFHVHFVEKIKKKIKNRKIKQKIRKIKQKSKKSRTFFSSALPLDFLLFNTMLFNQRGRKDGVKTMEVNHSALFVYHRLYSFVDKNPNCYLDYLLSRSFRFLTYFCRSLGHLTSRRQKHAL